MLDMHLNLCLKFLKAYMIGLVHSSDIEFMYDQLWIKF